MEENNIKEEKVTTTKKFTYEQLESIAANLSSQVQQLSMKLEQINMANVFKRLDYCFKVIDSASALLSPEFVERCAKEIEELMTPPKEEEDDSDNKE